MIAVETGPGDADPLVTGALLAGSLVTGALVVSGGGALLVSGSLGGGALLVTGSLGGGGGGGGGSLVVALDVVLGGGGGVDFGGGSDAGAEDDGPGPLPDGEDGEDGGVEDGDEGEDGGGSDVVPEDEDPGGVPDPPDAPPDVSPDVPPEAPPDFPSDEPPDAPSATLSVTNAPNPSSAPAGGSDAVTRAPSAGRSFPAYPTARPRPVNRRLASANVVPARSGTARCFSASKVLSRVPVVPTGRSMPRPGSATSTRASRAIFRGAGCTDTTEERRYPSHFLLPASNLTEILFVSPAKGRSGFPHEHFTAGIPRSSTRTAIPDCSRELKGVAFPFL